MEGPVPKFVLDTSCSEGDKLATCFAFNLSLFDLLLCCGKLFATTVAVVFALAVRL